MEKTITIDGQEVKFSANAAFPIIYKKQFGHDILTILMPLISEALKGADELLMRSEDDGIMPSDIGTLLESVYSLEMVDMLNLCWALAKSANPDIDEPIKWFAKFNEFPIIDVMQELSEILLPSLISKKKLKTMEAKLKTIMTNQ
ncbi:hypothetical protein [Peptoniphilus sp.]|jgi:hypothetical protein|uniref:hypothetical protein n=1 Tax=Peptoniphilus sp. TaxID=1971214 RepID=UPI003D8C6330